MPQQDNNIEPAKQGIPVMLVAQPVDKDEVSLLDMWPTLFKRRWLILLLTGIATLIGLVYATTAPNVYKAETILLPPTVKQITELQSLESFLNKDQNITYTRESVFEAFAKTLNSKAVRNGFFLHQGVVEKLYPDARSEVQKRGLFNIFDKNLVFDDNVLSLQGTTPIAIVDWVNDFPRIAAQQTRDEILSGLRAKLELEKLALKAQIRARIGLAEREKANAIDRLEEAISTARKLGINDYALSGGDSEADGSGKSGNISIATTSIPIYMRGVKALQAELSTLKERKDSRSYAPGLTELQEKLFVLDALRIEPENVAVMRIDERALLPVRIQPKRKRITAGAALAGLLVGILAAFAMESVPWRRRRKPLGS